MINIYKKILLVLLASGACGQNICADESESFVMNIAKGSAGALVGGGIFYLLSNAINGQTIAVHESKMKFLEDLALFIESPEYSKGDSSRLFTHYYNGLNQLAQSTRDVEIALLHEFANCHSEDARKEILNSIEKLQSKLQSTHEKNLWTGNVIMTVFGAVIGAVCSLPINNHGDSCDCLNHEHHHGSTTYVGNFARAAIPSNNIFSRR